MFRLYSNFMEDLYEYRHAPSKGAIWLAALGVVLLTLIVVLNDADHLIWTIWVAGAVTVAWMIQHKPIFGIKIDQEYLVLGAWRDPRYIRLEDIAYLRATNVSEETTIAIVYKDGDEEGIFAADLPDIDTLITVLADYGVPVRDVY
jgi:hypothetical protein